MEEQMTVMAERSRKPWHTRLAPGAAALLARFPLPVLLIAIGTGILILSINGFLDDRNDQWAYRFAGFYTAALVAAAGRVFSETRPDRPLLGILLSYPLPLLVVPLFEFSEVSWLILPGLPCLAILWFALSPATRLSPREGLSEQDFFWWFNHTAFTVTILALTNLLIVAAGIAAIERSLLLLFTFSTGDIFYKWVLPLFGALFTPCYWLATLPRPAEYLEGCLATPDRLSKAVAFLGQYILIPLVLVYALILLAYAAQIAITHQIPSGVVSWMFIAFVSSGILTWMFVYPAFMRSLPAVRLFRAVWFWLPLPPLVLYAIAVWMRVEAFGLTAERVALIAFGIWTLVICLFFLVRRGDLRLIPGLAAVFVLILSIGPWNAHRLAIADQSARLEAALAARPADADADWPEAEAARARSAIGYLAINADGQDLAAIMARHDVSYDPTTRNTYQLNIDLGLDREVVTETEPYQSGYLVFTSNSPVNVAETPVMVEHLSLYSTGGAYSPITVGDLDFSLDGDNRLSVRRAGDAQEVAAIGNLDLTSWVEAQEEDNAIREPVLELTIAERRYRYVVTELATMWNQTDQRYSVDRIEGVLFTTAEP